MSLVELHHRYNMLFQAGSDAQIGERAMACMHSPRDLEAPGWKMELGTPWTLQKTCQGCSDCKVNFAMTSS